MLQHGRAASAHPSSERHRYVYVLLTSIPSANRRSATTSVSLSAASGPIAIISKPLLGVAAALTAPPGTAPSKHARLETRRWPPSTPLRTWANCAGASAPNRNAGASKMVVPPAVHIPLKQYPLPRYAVLPGQSALTLQRTAARLAAAGADAACAGGGSKSPPSDRLILARMVTMALHGARTSPIT